MRLCWGRAPWIVLLALAWWTSPAFAQTFTYDGQGRLATAVYADGTKILYCYDFAGNRTQYVVASSTPTCSAAVANAVSATVTRNTTNSSISPNIYGGAATSIAISTAPTQGTATVSGLTLLYTPYAGYLGPDSFQYTATNASGTSRPATVSVTVAVAVGNILFDEIAPAQNVQTGYSFTIPSYAPGYVTVYLYGGGGGAHKHGGGGGGFVQKHFAVTPGTTVLSGNVGGGGNGWYDFGHVQSAGAATTMSSPSMRAGPGGASADPAGGAGGNASGGDVNTAGEAGDTGGIGNGGANLGLGGGPRQTAAGVSGYSAGGGGAGSIGGGGDGADGEVIIVGQPN